MKLKILILLTFLSAACSGGRLGYLVVVWPPEDSGIKAGEIVNVLTVSEIRNVYGIESSESKMREEISRFRGRFFRKKSDAEEFRDSFIPYKKIFAYSETALPVRALPDQSSERVYRLRPSQVVKIVGKLPEKVTVNNLEGYWYQIITDDGYEGYCFDRNLSIYEFTDDKSDEESEKEYLDNFFINKWYPTSYLEAVESSRIVINNLRTGEGIFPDLENSSIVVQTPAERIEYSFDSIAGAGQGRVIFRGTPLEIIFYPGNRLYVTFVHGGIDYSGFYGLLDKSIDQYIKEEQERRLRIIREISSRGNILISDLYGEISLRPGAKFIWLGYINLVPEIIPFGYGVSGTMRGEYFLSQELSSGFDGIISFVFERTGREIVFASRFTNDGIQFTHVPSEFIVDEMVAELPEERNVYYFRYGASADQE